jgi:cyclic pyranopterin phosphate synthase
MPGGGASLPDHDQVLDDGEIIRLCGIFVSLGIHKIKITGGEPLVRNGVVELVERLKKMPGLKSVTMTTNGLLLADSLDRFIKMGLDGVNIHLDTLDRETYRTLTGMDGLSRAMDGLSRVAAGGIPVKVNCVPIRGVNDGDLAMMADLARDRIQAVRFIELMPIGQGSREEGIPIAEVKRNIVEAYGPLMPWPGTLGNGPASYCQVDGFRGKIGFIQAVSHGFCEACNRVRLTADGYLKLCLDWDLGIDLKAMLRTGASDSEITEAALHALEKKPGRHGFNSTGAADRNSRDMHRIGG